MYRPNPCLVKSGGGRFKRLDMALVVLLSSNVGFDTEGGIPVTVDGKWRIGPPHVSQQTHPKQKSEPHYGGVGYANRCATIAALGRRSPR